MLHEARQATHRLRAMSTDALIATKRLFQGARQLPEQLAVEAETIATLAATPAAREAILRFIDK